MDECSYDNRCLLQCFYLNDTIHCKLSKVEKFHDF